MDEHPYNTHLLSGRLLNLLRAAQEPLSAAALADLLPLPVSAVEELLARLDGPQRDAVGCYSLPQGRLPDLAASSHLTAVADLLEEFTKHARNLYERPEQALADAGRALAAARLAAPAAGRLLPHAEAALHAAGLPLVQNAAQQRQLCWDAVVGSVLSALALARLFSLRDGLWEQTIRLLRGLPEPDVLLAIIQRRWSVVSSPGELYALLPAAVPLLLADPALLPQLLAGEEWVREQFRW